MIKHWEYTLVTDKASYDLFAKKSIPVKLPSDVDLPFNTAVYVIPEGGGSRLEGVYDPDLRAVRPLKTHKAPNRDLRLYLDALMTDRITILAVDGLMGTGKTSTAVEWVAQTYLSNLKVHEHKVVDRREGDHKILIAKPHVNASGEEYGHLPGDINEKIEPTISNFVQYFDRFTQAGYDALKEAGYVSILPLGFVRGMDADNMTVITDECQNTRELVTITTRRAKGSRIFLLGDTSPFQIDLAGNAPKKNGLTDITDLLRGAPYFQYIEMKTLEHIVRSDEVRDIVRRLFKKYGQDPQEWQL